MKNLILFSFLLLTACSKSLNRPAANGATYMKYTIAGTNIQFNGSNDHMIPNTEGAVCRKITADVFKVYDLIAQRGSGNNGIYFVIATDSLTVNKTYPMKSIDNLRLSMVIINVDGKGYTSLADESDPPTFFLTITRNSHGSIDGTFSGKLYSILERKLTPVTGGEFRNVHVIY